METNVIAASLLYPLLLGHSLPAPGEQPRLGWSIPVAAQLTKGQRTVLRLMEKPGLVTEHCWQERRGQRRACWGLPVSQTTGKLKYAIALKSPHL